MKTANTGMFQQMNGHVKTVINSKEKTYGGHKKMTEISKHTSSLGHTLEILYQPGRLTSIKYRRYQAYEDVRTILFFDGTHNMVGQIQDTELFSDILRAIEE